MTKNDKIIFYLRKIKKMNKYIKNKSERKYKN